MSDHLMSTYAPLPVTFERGEGAWLWDKQGNIYLDALSGIGVCGLGHAHPNVTEAINAQAKKLLHTSNLYTIELQNQLAEKLCQLAAMDKAFFCNSGAEAIEAAIKLARLHGHQNNISQPSIIVAENSFHGRTMATLSATGNRKVQAGFEPLVQGFIRAPYNDIEAIRTIAQRSPNVVAILIEPIQGEGGINIPGSNYLTEIRALCDENGWLMMLDEIQSGMCRTGKWFAYQHSTCLPDVVCLAKGLGNGIPIGACLARGKAADVFKPGTHGTTFGGNPLVCSAALAVIQTLEEQQLAAQANELGNNIRDGLRNALAGCDAVKEIRGVGMMIGIELNRPCIELVKIALKHSLLISVQAEHVVRLLPPLIISSEEAYQIVNITSTIIKDFASAETE